MTFYFIIFTVHLIFTHLSHAQSWHVSCSRNPERMFSGKFDKQMVSLLCVFSCESSDYSSVRCVIHTLCTHKAWYPASCRQKNLITSGQSMEKDCNKMVAHLKLRKWLSSNLLWYSVFLLFHENWKKMTYFWIQQMKKDITERLDTGHFPNF